MCARLLIVTICLLQANQLDGLKYSGKTSWPYWPGPTMKSFGTANFTLGNKITEETCELQDTPNPNDKYKSVCISGLMTLNTWLDAAGEGQFPIEYGMGIVISAGPPPKELSSDSTYKYNNWKDWQDNFNHGDDDNAEKFAHGALGAELAHLKSSKGGGIILTYSEITGVYEGQKESSYLVGLNETIDFAYSVVGERLRAQFFQDSYLWYEERINRPTAKCPQSRVEPVTNAYYRKFGLGFGTGSVDYGTDGTFELGHLCEYTAPTEDKFPQACSVQGNTMWAQTDKAFTKAAAAKKC